MKKALTILIIWLSLLGTAHARIDVLYLPESGFLRVSGEVTIEPETSSLSLLIFPTAHLTEFWADYLVEYNVQRYPHGTEVVFAVRDMAPQKVTFSYEGLVEPKLVTAALGPDQLWLPEFSVPVQGWEVVLQIPSNWEVVSGKVQEAQNQGSFRRVDLPSSDHHPALILVNTNLAPEPVPEQLEREELVEQQVPSPNPDRHQELLARINLQVNRFTRALNLRSTTELAELLSPDLQEKGLAEYLASLPEHFGQVSSKIVQLPGESGGDLIVFFSTERGGSFSASMVWEDTGVSLVLNQFRLTPYSEDVPQEVFDSYTAFLQELKAALESGELSRLENLLAPDLRQDVNDVIGFLRDVFESREWTLEQATLDPFAITILAAKGEEGRLLIGLELIPGQHHWLIQEVHAVPLP